MREYHIYASRGSQTMAMAVQAHTLRDAWKMANKNLGGGCKFVTAFVPEYGKSFNKIK